MRILLCFLSLVAVFLLSTADLVAQNIVPPPPNSASLARGVEHAVNLHTGVPSISIPLYTVSGTKLAYPVSLNYNASGNKINDKGGEVGLGWSLNALGVITRTVRGKPDEFPSSYLQYAPSIPNATDAIPLATLSSIADGNIDMMPDIFYFSTALSAGKFMFDNNKVPQTIPKAPVTVSFNSLTDLNTATVTSYDGTKMVFIGGETCAMTPALGGGTPYYSTWYLSKIVSADKTDSIQFNYITTGGSSYQVVKNGYLYYFYDVPSNAVASHAQYEINRTFGDEYVSVVGTKYIESIESSKEKVVFSYVQRTDLPDLKRVQSVSVFHKDPLYGSLKLFKTIDLTYTDLLLTGLQEKSSINTTLPAYEILYNGKEPFLNGNNMFAQDPWGYYNGVTTNTTLAPATTFAGNVISDSDRTIHAEWVDIYQISQIKSPLGEITTFEFENNRYGSSATYGPGLRIKKVTKQDPFSNISAVTNYEYLNPVTGLCSGVLLENPSYTETHIPVTDIVHGETYNYWALVKPVHSTGIGAFSGPPLVYEYVIVYHGDDYNVAGKTVSKFSLTTPVTYAYPYFSLPDNSWKSGNPLEVTQYKVEANVSTPVSYGANNFVEHPTYSTIKGFHAGWTKMFISAPIDASGLVYQNYLQESKFIFADLSTTRTYQQNSATIYAETTENSYYDRTDGFYLPNKIRTATSETGIEISKEFTYAVDYPSTGTFGLMHSLKMFSYPVDVKTILHKAGTDYVIGYQKTDYAEFTAGKVYPQTTYQPKLATPIAKSTFDASPSTYYKTSVIFNKYENGVAVDAEPDGGSSTATLFDPFVSANVAAADNASTDQLAYSSFESSYTGKWDLGPTTEQRILTYNGIASNFSIIEDQTVSYNYTVTQTAGPRPIVTLTAPGQTDIEITLLTSSGSGTVYLPVGSWSATLTYETNVSSASFTINIFRPWSIEHNDAKTGGRSLKLTEDQSATKNGLDLGQYIITYYQKNGAATFSLIGGSEMNSETLPAGPDGWALVTKTINITAGYNVITLSGENILIDELRLYPVGSFMKTTCYDPMKRVHTVTDINLQSQFYEYDEWGRVVAVRDHDKAIVQHYEYKLAGGN